MKLPADRGAAPRSRAISTLSAAMIAASALAGRASARCSAVAVLALAALAGAPTTASAADGTTAIAWGWNIKEQLGAGYKSSAQTSPVPVVGLTNIKALAAGYGFSLALLGDGTLRSWGGNAYG